MAEEQTEMTTAEPEAKEPVVQERVLVIVTDGTKVDVRQQTMTNLEALQACQMMIQHVQVLMNQASAPVAPPTPPTAPPES